MELFAKATKNKFRFPSLRGNIGTEDLWDLGVEDLNEIYKNLASQKTSSESLIPDVESEANNMINEKMLVVKTIYDFKENERKAAMEASENRAKKQKILQILAEKKEGDLREKSAEELQEMLDSLD